MRRHVRSIAATTAIAVALVVVALPHGAGAADATTTPTRYVRQVCAALNNWNNTSDDDSALLKALNSDKKSPRSARQAIAALYAVNAKATDQLITATEAIGIPRLANGQQLASDYVKTLGDIRAVYTTAQKAVTHAPATNKTALANAVGAIDSNLSNQLSSIGDPLTALSTDSTLASAIQGDSGCGDVIAGYKSATSSGLKVGDCATSDEKKVACTQSHDEEVTLVTSYPASSTAPFPGNDAIQSFVDQNCAPAFSAYVGISADQSTSYTYGSFSPNSGADWNSDDREIVCTVTNQDNTPITGSVKGQGAVPAATTGKQNGEANRRPDHVLIDAVDALTSAKSFTVTGSAPYHGQTIKVDLVVTSSHGGGGSVALNGATLSLVVAPPYFYLRADETFLTRYAHAPQATAQLLADKWLRTSTTSKQATQFVTFNDVSFWTTQLDDAVNKHLTKGSQRVFQGTPVVAVHQSGAGTLFVAATGTPFPVAVVPDEGGPNAGFVFGSFNTASPPAAPTGAIDLAKLR
jgi:hypothetical protein